MTSQGNRDTKETHQAGKSGVIILGQYIYCPIDTYARLLWMNASSRRSDPWPAEYHRLRQRLARLGWVALGSLVERTQPGQGGPRYQWSRRVAGKTITVALSKQQFQWLKRAIANQRSAGEILARMHHLTLQHLWKNLPGPSRRKRLSHKTLGLN